MRDKMVYTWHVQQQQAAAAAAAAAAVVRVRMLLCLLSAGALHAAVASNGKESFSETSDSVYRFERAAKRLHNKTKGLHQFIR